MGTGQSWAQAEFPRLACDHQPACGCTKEALLTHRSAEVAESGEAVVTLQRKPPPGLIPMTGDLEADTVAWIEVLTFHSRRRGQTYQAWLQDGVILCELANVIKPGIIETIHPPDASTLKKTENMRTR